MAQEATATTTGESPAGDEAELHGAHGTAAPATQDLHVATTADPSASTPSVAFTSSTGDDELPILSTAMPASTDNPVLRVQVLGPNPLLPVLLEHGFRIVDRDQFLASDPALVDPERLLPNPGML